MKRSLHLLLLCLTIGLGSAFPQAIGTPPYGSFGGGPFDVINLGNLNVHFTIPVFQRQGRGQSFYYNFTYDSSIWAPGAVNGQQTWVPAGGWGWQSQTNAATGFIPAPASRQTTCTYIDDLGKKHTVTIYIYTYSGFTDPLGTFHSVPGLIVVAGP